jgi:uncharacterized protein YydD (DUF2326 family)
MFLKSLKIMEGDNEVRVISFRKGLNLIVDETPKAASSSGNNVGKTTAIRAVDFCLGGTAKSLYEDPEFKKGRINKQVHDYVTREDVWFELELETLGGNIHTLKRSAAPRSKRYIDDNPYSAKQYVAELNQLLFSSNRTSPTFRQLIGKFVRADEYQLTRTLRYVHPNTTDEEYGAIHLFLFGFPDLDLLERWREKKYEERIAKKRLDTMRSVVGESSSKSSLEQSLAIIDLRINELEQGLSSYNVEPGVLGEIGELESVRSEVNKLSLELATLDSQVNFCQNTISQLQSSRAEVDANSVREIYEQAAAHLGSLARTFEEALNFHNSMIDNKLKFVQSRLAEIGSEKQGLSNSLTILLGKEQKLLASIGSPDLFGDLRKVHNELERVYQERGKKEAVLEQLNKLTAKVLDVGKDLRSLEEEMREQESVLTANLAIFNKFFSDISYRLYGTRYLLGIDLAPDPEGLKVVSVIKHAIGNPSTGAKKGELSAFDLAYVKYLSARSQAGPRFVFHDRVETIHINQISTLFAIAEEIDGQYIVAVLKERIDKYPAELIKQATILSLSEQDRFFRLKA